MWTKRKYFLDKRVISVIKLNKKVLEVNMENKSVVITGGSRGIGRACALLFASKGCNVLIGYNKNKEAAEAVLDEIKKGEREDKKNV